MALIFNSHGFHSDIMTTHTLCGGSADNRDLLLRRFIKSRPIFSLAYYKQTAWLVPLLVKAMTFVLLGKSCRDCGLRKIVSQLGGNICFCMDSTKR